MELPSLSLDQEKVLAAAAGSDLGVLYVVLHRTGDSPFGPEGFADSAICRLREQRSPAVRGRPVVLEELLPAPRVARVGRSGEHS